MIAVTQHQKYSALLCVYTCEHQVVNYCSNVTLFCNLCECLFPIAYSGLINNTLEVSCRDGNAEVLCCNDHPLKYYDIHLVYYDSASRRHMVKFYTICQEFLLFFETVGFIICMVLTIKITLMVFRYCNSCSISVIVASW